MAIRKTDPRGIRAQQDVRGEVQEFFDVLAHAVTAGDGETVASMYEVPALIISDDGVHAIDSPSQIGDLYGAAREQHNAQGIFDTRADLIDLERIGTQILVATVRWPHLDANHKEVAAEESDYTLRRDEAGRLRIRSVLMRGVSPRRR